MHYAVKILGRGMDGLGIPFNGDCARGTPSACCVSCRSATSWATPVEDVGNGCPPIPYNISNAKRVGKKVR